MNNEALRLIKIFQGLLKQRDAEDDVIFVPRWTVNESMDELRRLNETNQTLLEALKLMALEFNFGDINQGEKFAIDKAKAAIAKAEVTK